MDAVQTLSNEINKYLSANELYNTYKKQWKYLLESYVGGEEYRRAGHLTRYANESPAEYDARLRTTPLQNHCASVISVYNSFLFRNPPMRKYENIANLPELTDFLYDADMDGRSFNAFMKDVSTYSSIFGHCWVLVVKPNIGASNRAEEMAAGVRPYVSLLTPLVVTDWEWTRMPNGRYALSYFKYLEEVNGDVTTVKEWTNDVIITTVVDENANSIISQTIEENGLGKIPAVIAYNKRSIIRGIGVSDIADIADAQKFIYNATSEIDQSIRLDSHPSLVKTPETQAGIGAGSIIHMPENLDPGLKPYALEFSGASVEAILNSINHTVEAIDKMANTGAVRATESRTMSGVAMETEFSLLNAKLSEKGDALELAEEMIWMLWCEYMGTTWEGVIDYPNSFNIRDSRNDLEMYMKAVETPISSPTYKRELYKSIAGTVIEADNEVMERMMSEIDAIEMDNDLQNENMEDMEDMEDMDDEDEGFEIHIMMDPTTGEMTIAKTEAEHTELAEQGWVHI